MNITENQEISMTQAARLLRVGVPAVRRLIDMGKLERRMIQNGLGEKAVVCLDQVKALVGLKKRPIKSFDDAITMAKKDVYTSGDVARILKVAPRTVGKWIDRGILQGYRIPASEDRRVLHQNLVKMVAENNMPLSLIPGYFDGVLLISANADLESYFSASLGDDVEVVRTPSWFQGGAEFFRRAWACIVVDMAMGTSESTEVIDFMMKNKTVRVFAVIPEDGAVTPPGVVRLDYSRSPENIDKLQDCLELVA